MTADLIAFLNARLDEDEAMAARAADSSRRDKCAEWVAIRDGNGYVMGDEAGHFAFCLVGGATYARHTARHDPARVLREVAAKRKIVTWHAQECTCAWVDEEGDDLPQPDTTGYSCPTLLMLAAVYSGHPDYREEWKP